MKIALLQSHIKWEDKVYNIEYFERILEKYSMESVDLFLLPEMSFPGFHMHTDERKEDNMHTLSLLKKMSAKYGVAIGAGYIKSGEEKCENHYAIVTPDGKIADYAKIHPFSFSEENVYYTGGNSIIKCRYKEFEIGIQICYDLRFPDIFMQAAADVDLMVVPANWPAARAEHWNTLLRARAIENQVYVAGINCAGDIGGLYYSGDSAIYNPDGQECECIEYQLSGNCSEAKILLFNIDNDVQKYREAFLVLKDRKSI